MAHARERAHLTPERLVVRVVRRRRAEGVLLPASPLGQPRLLDGDIDAVGSDDEEAKHQQVIVVMKLLKLLFKHHHLIELGYKLDII
jgi:hypothetical protein